MIINMRLASSTIRNTEDRIKAYFRRSDGIVSYISISNHLKGYLNHAPATYNAELKALHRLLKYLNRTELMESFKMAPVDSLVTISEPPTREQVRPGFKTQETTLAKAVYIFLATTGLRKGELLSLKKEHVNLDNRSVVASHYTRSKRSGVTFYNEEAETWLRKYLEERTDNDPGFSGAGEYPEGNPGHLTVF